MLSERMDQCNRVVQWYRIIKEKLKVKLNVKRKRILSATISSKYIITLFSNGYTFLWS